MYEKYLSKETIKNVHEQSHDCDGKNVSTMAESWIQWCSSLQKLIKDNVAPDDESAQKLMEHWELMIGYLANNDDERIKKLNELFHNEPMARADHGITDEMFDYMGKTTGGH